ncbi:TATA element modulatory factor 1 TATA binding-domain-containing protein [Lasiosphaeris hirsuta]|uniref:TATA element modulatory factor 1 TATA binding-domain-containing protein n=1 Tax=Lasiosphaeris hirsuta TaxID=260670 RepID=A0AA40EB36_9PEZI|nr:TATA element modulatory factor 1 TATA binding-domain-containing protein [Lasiosphaeris hirsuta]
MAAPARQPSSRWGSFLSQAVAGVEARLDNILADAENEAAGQAQQPKPNSAASSTSPVKSSPGPSRSASTARTPNDRLQERLARAIAAKAAGQKPDAAPARSSMSTQGSPRQSLDAPSRASIESLERSSPAPKELPKDAPSPRSSQEVARKSQGVAVEETGAKPDPPSGESQIQEPPDKVNGVGLSEYLPLTVSDSLITSAPPQSEQSVEVRPDDTPKPETLTSSNIVDEGRAKNIEKPQEDALLQHQEEIHGYVERIDALEAKLQYLAREASEAARKAALAAPTGSPERKLAEKDQQIAQLMEEGKNLASTEQKHRAILKKLRLKISEDEKDLNNIKSAKEKSEKEMENLRRRARRADELEKAQDDLQRRLEQAQRELSTLRPETRSKDSIIAELGAQLQKATEQADAMAVKVNDQARGQDRRRILELEETVAGLEVEKNLVADRARIQANDLKEKAERANERSRALELELKAEVQVMESKLEATRIRAEEASSGAIGDSQAKLLRQVETLQTQYSIASENWQGIEATLLARIASMETERDEALQRESDMRRKAREAAVRAKRNEEELEETKTKLPGIQEDVRSYQSQLNSLKKRAEEAEAALVKSRADFEKQKQAWEAEKEEKQTRQPVERRSWLEDLPGTPFLKSDSRPESPQLSLPHRTFSTDFLGIQNLTGKRKVSVPSSNSDVGAGESHSNNSRWARRPSAQPLTRPSVHTGGIFSPSMSVFSPTSEVLPTPSSTHPLDREPVQGELRREDTFDSMDTSSSPQQVMQDMVSVSTVGAGPSVQLVERMSAAIRRLESEKVAAREELARISRQRDEARAEIVALMREAESGKASVQRVAALEAEVAEVNARYETTLEMLGEKSEMVEELKADVQDVKAMYRELVERTIK